jgi:hypothetical protein
MGVENKKAVKSDPGEKTPQLVADALPHSGSGSGLTAHLPWFSHLAMFALYHTGSGCAIPDLCSGFLWDVGEGLPEAAQAFNRSGNHMNHPTRLQAERQYRLLIHSHDSSPRASSLYACRLLAGSSPFPLACAYTAPHLNQASPLVTNTAGDCRRKRNL